MAGRDIGTGALINQRTCIGRYFRLASRAGHPIPRRLAGWAGKSRSDAIGIPTSILGALAATPANVPAGIHLLWPSVVLVLLRIETLCPDKPARVELKDDSLHINASPFSARMNRFIANELGYAQSAAVVGSWSSLWVCRRYSEYQPPVWDHGALAGNHRVRADRQGIPHQRL